MRTLFDPELDATLTLDDSGEIRGVNYLAARHDFEHLGHRDAAAEYLRRMAPKLNIDPGALRSLSEPVSYLDPQPREVEYRLADEKPLFDAATLAYYQTYLNTPIWAAGVTVTVTQSPARIVAMTNTSEHGIDAKLPAERHIERYRRLFASGEKVDGPSKRVAAPGVKTPGTVSMDLLSEILGNAAEGMKSASDQPIAPRLIRGRFFVYRFVAARRTADHPEHVRIPNRGHDDGEPQHGCDSIPLLPLPSLPKSIQDQHWYLVAELVFRLPYRGSRMNWRMLVDVETNAVLYLRALASGVNGLVFTYDPITSTGTATNTPDQSNAVLNPFRDDVVLDNLNPPSGGIQSLQGSLVTLSEIELATVPAPTLATGTDFDFDVRTNDFAAVNAYYHNDRFFRLVESLGFPLATYFDGTSFPVEVDHRGIGSVSSGNTVNAHCIGDGDGIDHACYALAETSNLANPVGFATDWRWILHELGGHGILYDHVNSANFGFAHSAGDSFAMILNDYLSAWHDGAAIDRFLIAPFTPAIVRRSDRTVAAGWGWDGPNDDNGYSSEQILSTTLFRVYRSIGGDSTDVNRREFAARCMCYLTLRAVGTLTPMSNPGTPALFLAALTAADAGDWTSEGVFGGAYGKVLTWSFERQNLNGGARPDVDVYIDDGRAGEYEYLANYSSTPTVWNRLNPDGLSGHQEPAGTINYAYVKIKNRGTAIAKNIVVRGYHRKPAAGLVWPNNLQPMTTPQVSGGTLQPDSAEEKTVGPFAWTPATSASGHDSILMIVSATGDSSNADNFTAGEFIEDWRLVPNDNNIALRDVTLIRLSLLIADSGNAGKVCVGSFKDIVVYLSNSGFNPVTITAVTSSSAEFLVPNVSVYPLTIAPGTAMEVPIRFEPTSHGAKASTITVFSSDPAGPRTVVVSGTAPAPHLSVVIATGGSFGKVCLGSHLDQMLTLNNSGECMLMIGGIASSSADFTVPTALSYPLRLGPGSALQVPIRFQPTGFGSKSATITVTSNDPSGPCDFDVAGEAPPGTLAVTGSLCFGGIKACCRAERRLSICNVGECALRVTSVAFKRKNPHWKLINNPFPATLRPGSCLDVTIRYKATEKCPIHCELVIISDDPVTPVKTLDVMAYTVWNECGCKHDDGGACGCSKSPVASCCDGAADDCCSDEDDEGCGQ